MSRRTIAVITLAFVLVTVVWFFFFIFSQNCFQFRDNRIEKPYYIDAFFKQLIGHFLR